jgi:hypothetical protein
MYRLRLLLLFVPLSVLAACASDPAWVNPAVPKDQWSRDLRACRRAADQEVGRGNDVAPDDRSSNPMRLAEQADVRKQFDSSVAGCMEDRGYHPAK